MVDKEARTKMAELIRQLIAGKITNDEFEDSIPQTKDRAVFEVFFSGLWGIYTDLKECRLVGADAVPKESRPVIARYILFLKSDHEYEWPITSFFPYMLWMLAALLTLGWSNRIYQRRFSTHGDVTVWPFIRQNDYQKALENPPYFKGSITSHQ